MQATGTTTANPPAIRERHAFLTGSGEPVPPKCAQRFTRTLVDRVMDDNVHGQHDFVLGFAACFDAIARGTIDLDEHPLNVVMQAYKDIHNITATPNKVTNIMKEIG